MKRPAVIVLLFSIVFIAFARQPLAQVIDTRALLNTTFDSIDKVKTLYFKLEYKERIYDNGKLRHDSSTTKYQKSPLRIYMKMANGAELLWGPDANDGDVLVHPNSFPYFNLNLNPDGYWMRKNQHHGIDEMGLAYFECLLKAEMNKAGKDYASEFFYQGEVTFGVFRCYHVLLIFPGFKFIPYTVQKGETVLTIAHKLCLNEYMILKYNKLGSYTDVKVGQTISVPNHYAQQISLYIDKQTMLPVMIRADDDKGLFEEYDYKSLNVNPLFKSEEFSKDYKGYHF